MFRFGVDLDKTFQNGKQPLSDDVIGTLAVQVYGCRPPLIPEVKTQSEREKKKEIVNLKQQDKGKNKP